jgi:hypothetical protein
VTKAIQIPKSMADPNRRYINNIRFACKDSNEFLLLFMCDGVVFCIETLSESFVTQEDGNSDIAKVARF